jgi:serine/threonine protein kinase
MPDTVRTASEEKPLEGRSARSEADGAPLLLKQGIAALAPIPLAQGGFGQIYLGKILNPLGLLAERIVWGEESPRWLGLGDIPYEEVGPESPRLPSPMLDPKNRERVYGAATRLWREYRERRQLDPVRADEEFKDWLGLIDPLLREDRTIAVKVLQPSRPSDSSDGASAAGETLRRFIKENDLLRRLEHPGIVRRFGLVRDPGLGWCLLLEYIEGKTLEEHLDQFEGRRMPLPLAARLIGELALAVEYIQSKGIIHRDLKPQNIMIRRDSSSAVIMDFGIGKWIDEPPGEQLTMVGVRLGTPRYMAPEQAAAGSGLLESRTTPLTDVYQLSTLLFEMVTGHAAYEGLESNIIFSWLSDPARRHPTYVQDFLPGISQEFEALIEIGREKDVRARWTVSEFRSKLDNLIREGIFEKRRHRKSTPASDLRRSLEEARIRRKEALWKEHVFERELAHAEVEQRIEEIRGRVVEADWKKAREGLDQLRAAGRQSPSLPERVSHELESIEKAIRLGTARTETAALLVQAESDYAAERYTEVGATLAQIAQALIHVPRKGSPDLHERYKKLARLYDAHHRSFVELFTTLRGAFVEKIRTDYHRLHDLYGAGRPIGEAEIDDVLRKVEAARKNLETIDEAKVGRAAHESARRELAEQEIALRDLRKRIRAAKPPGGPKS